MLGLSALPVGLIGSLDTLQNILAVHNDAVMFLVVEDAGNRCITVGNLLSKECQRIEKVSEGRKRENVERSVN